MSPGDSISQAASLAVLIYMKEPEAHEKLQRPAQRRAGDVHALAVQVGAPVLDALDQGDEADLETVMDLEVWVWVWV